MLAGQHPKGTFNQDRCNLKWNHLRFLLPHITEPTFKRAQWESLAEQTEASRWLVYLHWPRSGVWTLRAVTAEGVMAGGGATAVSWRCSSSGVGKLLGAGEGLAVS